MCSDYLVPDKWQNIFWLFKKWRNVQNKNLKNERSAYALKCHDPQFKISNMNLFQENDLIIDNFFSFLNAFYCRYKITPKIYTTYI